MKITDKIWLSVSSSYDVDKVLHSAMISAGWQPGNSNIAQKLLTANKQLNISEGDFSFSHRLELKLRWAQQQKSETTEEVLLLAGSIPSTYHYEYLPDSHDGHVVFLEMEQEKANNEYHLRELILELKEKLLEENAVFLAVGRPKPDPSIFPSARFATQDELVKAGYLAPCSDPRRFIIAKQNEAFISLPSRESNRHVLICGPTGSGKSRSVLTPNLIERTDVSMIVTEATAGDELPHLYNFTAGYRAGKRHRILYFNPDDLSSDQINPLDMVNTDRDARMVCDLIMKSTTQQSHRGDQFWDMSERMLLTALILHVCGYRKEGAAHLGHIAELVNQSEKDLRKVAWHSPTKQSYERLQAFFSRGTENTRNIVLSCLGQRLDSWNDVRTQALTKRTSFDVQQLKDELFTFYLVLSAEKTENKTLAILIWHFIMHMVSNNRFKHPISLILDEFSNLGYIRGMKEKLSLFRHLDIGVVIGIQDEEQISIVYKEEAPLFFSQPATKLFLTPGKFPDAKRISDALGVTTVTHSEIQGGSVRQSNIQKQLLTAEEIMNPRIENQLITFLPKTRPIQIGHIGWNEYDRFEHDFPPPLRDALEVDEGFVFRYPEDQPGFVPFDPMDPGTADEIKGQRDPAQVALDTKQEINFKRDEENRINAELLETQREIKRLEYYNAMKAHLVKEITALDIAQAVLNTFVEEKSAFLASNEGRTLTQEEKESYEMIDLKIRIMTDIVNDFMTNRTPDEPDNNYPLPWQN